MKFSEDDTSFFPIEREAPIHKASFEGNIKVPLMFALIVASVVAGLLACVYLAMYTETSPYVTENREPFSLYVIPAVWLLVLGIAFCLQFARSWAVLWSIETLTNLDLNGDGLTGKPETVLHEYAISLQQPEGKGKVLVKFTLPPGVNDEMLYHFFRGVLHGYGTATHTWAGAGQVFSRPQFDGLKAILISRGLACLLTPGQANSKWALTEEGELFGRQVVTEWESGNDES